MENNIKNNVIPIKGMTNGYKASGFSSLASFSQGPPLEPSYLLSQLLVVRIPLLNHPSLSCLCCLCLLYL